MTNKEFIERNLGLTFDFVNYLMDNPNEIKKLPDNFTLEFIEKDFPNIERMQKKIPETKQNRKVVRVRNSFELANI